MEIKEQLKKNLPDEIKKSPEFRILLRMISDKNLESIEKLSKYIDAEIKEINMWLEENRTAGTITGMRREKARKLRFLKAVRENVLELF